MSTTTMATHDIDPSETLSKLARWLPVVGIALAVGLGVVYGLGVGLLVAAGTALLLGIWGFWASLQNLSGDAPLTLDEALSLGAPTAEEEQKRAVLRALKDLEYERAVGKLSEADYTALSERYRQEAKRLLRQVERDLTPERERAERLLQERLAELGELEPSADEPESAGASSVERARDPEAKRAAAAAPKPAATAAEGHE